MIVLFLACEPPVDVLLADPNNYDFTSEISAAVTVVPSRSDSVVDWSGLTRDFLGEPMSPADVTTVQLTWFMDLSEEEVMRSINEADPTVENVLAVQYEPGDTSASMSEFSLNGTFIDIDTQVVAGQGTYLASVSSADRRFRMIELFRPMDGAAANEIVIDDASASITFEVDLSAGTALELPAGTADITLDWADLTVDGSGLPIRLPNIDRVVLARYDEDLPALEADFLHFDDLAEDRFEIDTAGFGSAILTRATDESGASFPGFDERNWFVALLCTTCLNPAPPFLARVSVP